MKKALVVILSFCLTVPMFGWGRRNHAAIAYIAQEHLTPEAYKTVKQILGGATMMDYASWLDDYREIELQHLPEPDAEGNTVLGIPHGFKADINDRPKHRPYKDATWVIEDSVLKLANYQMLDDSTRLMCLKNLIHLVGDIHCPLHVKYMNGPDNKGKYPVYPVGGEAIRYHTFVDKTLTSGMYPGGMMEMAYMCDPLLRPLPSQEDIDYMLKVQKGSVHEWAQEIINTTKWFYDYTEGHKFTIQEQTALGVACKDQMLRAGYRLARLLNELFRAK